MIGGRGLVVHGVILGVASILAVGVWTKEEAPKKLGENAVEVWGGKPEAVAWMSLESEDVTVRAEGKKDDQGRYWEVQLEKRPPVPKLPDGGVDPKAPPKPDVEKKSFIAVKAANDLAEALAPLMATRLVGKVEESRAEEFGFDKPQGTVKVSIGGKEHTLVLGGTTAGAADRYVREEATGSVFVVAGSTVRDLETADSRLIQRSLHEFEDDEITRVKVNTKDATREFVRMEDGKSKSWADSKSPEQKDETAENWIGKLERLRVTDFIPGSGKDAAGEDLVVKVDYYSSNRKIGYLELVKVAPTPGAEPEPEEEGEEAAASSSAAGPKADYIVRTETTRWWAKVTRSVAEQVAQDVGSVVVK